MEVPVYLLVAWEETASVTVKCCPPFLPLEFSLTTSKGEFRRYKVPYGAMAPALFIWYTLMEEHAPKYFEGRTDAPLPHADEKALAAELDAAGEDDSSNSGKATIPAW